MIFPATEEGLAFGFGAGEDVIAAAVVAVGAAALCEVFLEKEILIVVGVVLASDLSFNGAM